MYPVTAISASRRRPEQSHRAGHSMSNARPGVDFDAASGLLDRLDLEGDRHLVADDRAAGFQRQVDVDAEVLTV